MRRLNVRVPTAIFRSENVLKLMMIEELITSRCISNSPRFLQVSSGSISIWLRFWMNRIERELEELHGVAEEAIEDQPIA